MVAARGHGGASFIWSERVKRPNDGEGSTKGAADGPMARCDLGTGGLGDAGVTGRGSGSGRGRKHVCWPEASTLGACRLGAVAKSICSWVKPPEFESALPFMAVG